MSIVKPTTKQRTAAHQTEAQFAQWCWANSIVCVQLANKVSTVGTSNVKQRPWPHRTVFLDGGRCVHFHFCLPVKSHTAGTGPTEAELYAELDAMGHTVHCVESVDDAKSVLRDLGVGV